MRLLLVFTAVAVLGLAQISRVPITLQEASQMAVRENPRIQSAQFMAQAAEQQPIQIKSALYPTISASLTGAGSSTDSRIGAGGLNNPIIYSRFASGVNVNQLLFDFGRTSRLHGSAVYRARAEEDNAVSTRNAVVMEVHRAYYDGLRAEAVLRVAEETLKQRQLLVDQVQALADARLKSGLDLSFANVNLSEAKLLLATAHNERAAADAQLAALLGMPTTTSFELADVLVPDVSILDLQELLETAMRSRPELSSLAMELASATEFAEAERRLRFPAVSANAVAGAIPVRVQGLRNSEYAAAGLNVTLPFLNGGLFKARENEAALRARAAERSLRATQLEVARSVRLAVLNVTTAAERLKLARQLLENANQALELARSRYDLGLSSIVELSQAELARTQAEIQNADARYDYALQRSHVQFETGTLQ